MSETFSNAAVLKQRKGICPRHGEVHTFTMSYHDIAGEPATYQTPDLCGWCCVELIEKMVTHLQPLPEVQSEASH